MDRISLLFLIGGLSCFVVYDCRKDGNSRERQEMARSGYEQGLRSGKEVNGCKSGESFMSTTGSLSINRVEDSVFVR